MVHRGYGQCEGRGNAQYSLNFIMSCEYGARAIFDKIACEGMGVMRNSRSHPNMAHYAILAKIIFSTIMA